jgi:transcriptional regulator with XRE-family HTH domain
VPLVVWQYELGLPTLAGVPKLREEDRQFAQRLGSVLVALRERAGETRPQAAERLQVSDTSLGRWERGEHAPKGYDLGRLFRGYEQWGAQWEWFFEPPAIVTVDPVRSKLDELERAGAIAADEREARVAARRRRTGASRAGGRGTPPKRKRPQ